MEGETVEHVRFAVKSLSDGDQGEVETILGQIPGVKAVRIGNDGQAIDVTFDPRVVDVNAIRGALQENGFPADNVEYAATRDEPTV